MSKEAVTVVSEEIKDIFICLPNWHASQTEARSCLLQSKTLEESKEDKV